MVAYIRTLAEQLAGQVENHTALKLDEIESRVQVLREELDRLDPRNFRPDARWPFVEARRRMRILAKHNQNYWLANRAGAQTNPASAPLIRDAHALFAETARLLDAYEGLGSAGPVRSFAFVSDADLREIVERDYRELSVILMPDAAWKSAVVMAGSILEAILYDQLTRDATRVDQAMAHSDAPKKKGGVVKDIAKDTAADEWRLADLIKVAAGLNVIPAHQAASIDQVLRDYRNFVHPRKEIKREHPCREGHALQAKGSLDTICDHLDPPVP
jgi:hypothetical protein